MRITEAVNYKVFGLSAYDLPAVITDEELIQKALVHLKVQHAENVEVKLYPGSKTYLIWFELFGVEYITALEREQNISKALRDIIKEVAADRDRTARQLNDQLTIVEHYREQEIARKYQQLNNKQNESNTGRLGKGTTKTRNSRRAAIKS